MRSRSGDGVPKVPNWETRSQRDSMVGVQIGREARARSQR